MPYTAASAILWRSWPYTASKAFRRNLAVNQLLKHISLSWNFTAASVILWHPWPYTTSKAFRRNLAVNQLLKHISVSSFSYWPGHTQLLQLFDLALHSCFSFVTWPYTAASVLWPGPTQLLQLCDLALRSWFSFMTWPYTAASVFPIDQALQSCFSWSMRPGPTQLIQFCDLSLHSWISFSFWPGPRVIVSQKNWDFSVCVMKLKSSLIYKCIIRQPSEIIKRNLSNKMCLGSSYIINLC